MTMPDATHSADGSPIDLPPARYLSQEQVSTIVSDYQKYVPQGRTSLPVMLHFDRVHATASPTAGDSADAVGEDAALRCEIRDLKTDYREFFQSLNYNLTDPEKFNAFLMVHEDTHCRTKAMKEQGLSTLLQDLHQEFVAGKGITTASQLPALAKSIVGAGAIHVELVSESVADAHAVLIVAARDGAPTAEHKVLDVIEPMRGFLAGSTQAMDTHDSRETLQMTRDVIRHAPAQYLDDRTAFKTAIELGFDGANIKAVNRADYAQLETMQHPAFQRMLQSMSSGLQDAFHDFNYGAFPLSSFAISSTTAGAQAGSVKVDHWNVSSPQASPALEDAGAVQGQADQLRAALASAIERMGKHIQDKLNSMPAPDTLQGRLVAPQADAAPAQVDAGPVPPQQSLSAPEQEAPTPTPTPLPAAQRSPPPLPSDSFMDFLYGNQPAPPRKTLGPAAPTPH
jgi:hypothetical protein